MKIGDWLILEHTINTGAYNYVYYCGTRTEANLTLSRLKRKAGTQLLLLQIQDIRDARLRAGINQQGGQAHDKEPSD